MTKNQKKAAQQHDSNTSRVGLAAPTTAGDVCLGMFLQIARKYLFMDVRAKALIYVVMVVVLSLASEIVSLPNDFYIVQKNNVFNKYGTKIGWFWTCLLTTPFIVLTSYLHHGSKAKSIRDVTRIIVATFIWNYCTNGFLRFEQHTARCHGAETTSRNVCGEQGGKWIPGFDISGHAFLLIYSILIICEEASSFRYWPNYPNINSQRNSVGRDEFQTYTKYIQITFIGLFLLHLLWDFQLIVTLLYYHTFFHKLLGAVIGIFCWFVTYRVWYPLTFPHLPIRRHQRSN